MYDRKKPLCIPKDFLEFLIFGKIGDRGSRGKREGN
jgi:hypothetical protein